MRATLRYAVGVVCLALAIHSWIALGLVTPVFVTGSSMAPVLDGAGQWATCPHCLATSRLAAELSMNSASATCPHCRKQGLTDLSPTQPGTRLLVDRTQFLWRDPARGELSVWMSPRAELCVKRVVGLPGETVSLSEGDLWIDGRRYVKSLAEQRAVRLFVTGSPEREVLDVYEASAAVSRTLYAVPDHFLCFRCRWLGEQELLVRSGGNEPGWQVQLRPAHSQVRVQVHGRVHAQVEQVGRQARTAEHSSQRPWPQNCLVELSTFDRQLLVAVEGQVLLRLPLGHAPDAHAPELVSDGVEITKLARYRDLYYTDQALGQRAASPAVWQLGSDEWFVLGDHSPVSQDSRQWGPLPRRMLVGKPHPLR